MSLDSEGREKLLRTALGLTAAQAQLAFSMAIINDGIMNDAATEGVSDAKRQIIAESKALQFYRAIETPSDVGGLGVLKKWLKQRERGFTEAAREYGLEAPKGILLTGIPGTGKSLTVKTVAASWGVPLLRLDVASLYGGLMGESEQNVRRALQLAETVSPCVLWIDEIDKAFSCGDLDGGTSKRVVGSILSWMQDKAAPCFVAATANSTRGMPPELLRKGRFDEVFFLDLPTFEERKAIFTVHLRKHQRNVQNLDVDRLATAAESHVGAEIEQAVIDALWVGFNDGQRPITTDDVLSVLDRQVPLAVSQAEVIRDLRQWLHEGRAQSASFPEVREAEQQFVPIDVKKKGGGRK